MPRRGRNGPFGPGSWIFASAFLLPLLAPHPTLAAESAGPGVELRLPADIVYRRSVGPDSAVVFSHTTHFAYAQNRCTGCHPQPFRMLTPTHRVTHAEMNAGGSCATCHDGKHAFAVRDAGSCSACHSGIPSGSRSATAHAGAPSPGRPLPKPIAIPRGDASPGQVTFRHDTHMGGSRTCATCHPKPFPMAVKSRGAGAMHESDACGACHDGKQSFAVENAEACARCHAGAGGAP
jgi:c(7)-type cytochrome triheme protein